MSMKTRPVATILASAYLSAMLTSSIAPIRNNTIFAAAVDPMAAEKALLKAVSGLNAAGWAAAAEVPSGNQSMPHAVPVKVTPIGDPVMTDELMARLIKFAQNTSGTGAISRQICAIFDLCDGTANMPVRMLETENPGGHFFAIPDKPGSTDILIINKKSEGGIITIEAYLTDKTYKLRAAAISATNTPARLITNEKAAEKFKAELSLLAREAATLPPTGAAVAGNS